MSTVAKDGLVGLIVHLRAFTLIPTVNSVPEALDPMVAQTKVYPRSRSEVKHNSTQILARKAGMPVNRSRHKGLKFIEYWWEGRNGDKSVQEGSRKLNFQSGCKHFEVRAK